MTLLSMQLIARLGHLLVWHAIITSGSYKQRKVFHGTATSNGPEFTDEEKLEDAIGTIKRHAELLDEIVGAYGS